ncbi:hypothetical protein HYT02_02220 [Candidatus Gottesmanbacteria bacterium]|nr:hypothetical protein [Candidatus Gottesmanbacteria bacterium]
MAKDRLSYKHALEQSAFLRERIPEPKGHPITDYIRAPVNFVIQNALAGSGIQVFQKDHIRVLPDSDFDGFFNDMFELTTHPFTEVTFQELIEDDNSDDEIRMYNDSFGRSKKIYLRQSLLTTNEDNDQIPSDEIQIDQVLKIAPALLQYSIRRVAKPRIIAIDSDYKRQFVERIIQADASRASPVFSLEKQTEYIQRLLEYCKDKSLNVICTGVRVGLEVEGRILAMAQDYFDYTVLASFVKPILPALIACLKGRYDNYRVNTLGKSPETLSDRYYSQTLANSMYGIAQSTVDERLEQLGGFEDQEKLRLYHSGRYFENHLQIFPERGFLS